jgi:hypothetical protein
MCYYRVSVRRSTGEVLGVELDSAAAQIDEQRPTGNAKDGASIAVRHAEAPIVLSQQHRVASAHRLAAANEFRAGPKPCGLEAGASEPIQCADVASPQRDHDPAYGSPGRPPVVDEPVPQLISVSRHHKTVVLAVGVERDGWIAVAQLL